MLRQGLAFALLMLCTSASIRSNLQDFRNIFAANARLRNSSMTDSDVLKTVLFPTDSLIASAANSDLSAVDSVFVKSKKSVCAAAGAALALNKSVDPLAPLLARISSGRAPVTIFILGGMGGEIYPKPMWEAFDNTSALAKAVASATAGITDSVWSQSELAYVETPLSDIIKASSIKINGVVAYQVVWVKQPLGSLESLIDYQVVVPRVIRRITKLLNVIGDKIDDFVLLGYSRGAIDALEIMSQAPTLSWGSRLKGVIGLDGVVWGTPICDCALGRVANDTSGVCSPLSEMVGIVNKLLSDLVAKKTHFVQNVALMTEESAKFAVAALNLPQASELKATTLKFPSLSKTWSSVLKDFIFDYWNVWDLVSDYDGNIKRLKGFASAFMDSLEMFSTENRKDWFRNHTLPTDRLYIAVTSTMDDSSYVASSLHPDEYLMRDSFYMVELPTSQQLVDGVVTASREVFLPQAHMKLNSAQQQYEWKWAGMFAGNHLGVAMDVAFPTSDNWVSPFPRLALLDSLASWIAVNS